jgi:hypothetical protein
VLIRHLVCTLVTPDRGATFRAVLKFGDVSSLRLDLPDFNGGLLSGSLQGQQAELDLQLVEKLISGGGGGSQQPEVEAHVVCVQAKGLHYQLTAAAAVTSTAEQPITAVAQEPGDGLGWNEQLKMTSAAAVKEPAAVLASKKQLKMMTASTGQEPAAALLVPTGTGNKQLKKMTAAAGQEPAAAVPVPIRSEQLKMMAAAANQKPPASVPEGNKKHPGIMTAALGHKLAAVQERFQNSAAATAGHLQQLRLGPLTADHMEQAAAGPEERQQLTTTTANEPSSLGGQKQQKPAMSTAQTTDASSSSKMLVGSAQQHPVSNTIKEKFTAKAQDQNDDMQKISRLAYFRLVAYTVDQLTGASEHRQAAF